MFGFDKTDLSKVCRSCLMETEHVKSLYDQYSTNISVADMFLYITSLECSTDYNDLPIQICQDCLCQLRISYKFVLKCRESNNKIRNYLKELAKTREETVITTSKQSDIIANSNSTSVKVQDTSATDVLEAQCLNVDVKFEIDNELDPLANYLTLENNDLSIDPLTGIKLEDDKSINSDFIPSSDEVTFEQIVESLKTPTTSTEMQIDIDEQFNLIKDEISVKTHEENYLNLRNEIRIDDSIIKQTTINKPIDVANKPNKLPMFMNPVIVLDNLRISNLRILYPKPQTTNVVSKEINNGSTITEVSSDREDATLNNIGKPKRKPRKSDSSSVTANLFDISSIIQNVKVEQALSNGCKRCNVSFPTYGLLLDHYRQVKYTNMKLPCRFCKEIFESRHLFEHLKFRHRFRLNRLFTARLGDKRENPNACLYLCIICNKCFNHERNLNRHILTHYGEKPFPCTLCDLSFDESVRLKSHLYRHNNVTCEICRKSFCYNNQLDRHMLTHYNVQRVVPNKL